MGKFTAQEVKQRKRAMKKERARRRRRRILLLAIIGGGVMAAKAAKSAQKPQPTPGNGTVTFMDEEPWPLTTMMSEMIKGLLLDARKKALADRMNVSVAIQDLDNLDLATTMIFKGSDVTVANGVVYDVDIYIGTELGLLLKLAGVGKGKQFFDWLKTEDGKQVINALRKGRFRVRGAIKNAAQMALFQKFLTPTA